MLSTLKLPDDVAAVTVNRVKPSGEIESKLSFAPGMMDRMRAKQPEGWRLIIGEADPKTEYFDARGKKKARPKLLPDDVEIAVGDGYSVDLPDGENEITARPTKDLIDISSGRFEFSSDKPGRFVFDMVLAFPYQRQLVTIVVSGDAITTVDELRAECQRRILERYSLVDQVNAAYDGYETEMREWIEKMRAKYRKMRDLKPIPSDYQSDKHWPK